MLTAEIQNTPGLIQLTVMSRVQEKLSKLSQQEVQVSNH